MAKKREYQFPPIRHVVMGIGEVTKSELIKYFEETRKKKEPVKNYLQSIQQKKSYIISAE